MKVKNSLFLLLTLCIMVATVSGCSGSGTKGALDGKWAYIHDTENAALIIKSNGSATLDNVKYDCTYDDSYITLTDSNSQIKKLRYKFLGEDILLYKVTDYTYDGADTPNGIVGMWSDVADNWSYRFTEDGMFVEDGYFSGSYVIDEANGTVTLTYGDNFEDTVIYYSLSGSTLTVEYPWKMVKIK